MIESIAAKPQATTVPVGLASYWCEFAERTETHAFVCFIVRKDIFTREKTAQDEETWKQEQALDCKGRAEDKILLLYMKLPLKDGGGIWRGIF